MKVKVITVSKPEDEEAVISAVNITDNIKNAINILENGEASILGYKDQQMVPLNVSQIYYIESVDEKSFAYTKNDCYEIKYKLYELEEMLDWRFLRMSKSLIGNIRKIKNVKGIENARLCAILLNDEKIVISRSYVKDLKKKLGL